MRITNEARIAFAGWGEWADRSAMMKHHPLEQLRRGRAFINNAYSVQITDEKADGIGVVQHLWIRRHDNGVEFPWQDLQRIKNELVGTRYAAVEVFPRECDLVDVANMRHLYVMPFGYKLPFGMMPINQVEG